VTFPVDEISTWTTPFAFAAQLPLPGVTVTVCVPVPETWMLWATPGCRSTMIVPTNDTSPLRIGTRACTDTTPAGGPTFFTGALDEVAVFDRKLTASEITSLYNAR
jgi:hypothetical protein